MAWVKRNATHADCLDLTTRIRDEDLREILATHPKELPDVALQISLDLSYKSFAVMEDGVGCIAIFGTCKTALGGVPWMIASDILFERSHRKFIRNCKDYVKELTEDFAYSYNQVAVTNVKAHRWLSWMGFTIHTTQTNIVNGVQFYPFTFKRK